jgi:hypothetical protein
MDEILVLVLVKVTDGDCIILSNFVDDSACKIITESIPIPLCTQLLMIFSFQILLVIVRAELIGSKYAAGDTGSSSVCANTFWNAIFEHSTG